MKFDFKGIAKISKYCRICLSQILKQRLKILLDLEHTVASHSMRPALAQNLLECSKQTPNKDWNRSKDKTDEEIIFEIIDSSWTLQRPLQLTLLAKVLLVWFDSWTRSPQSASLARMHEPSCCLCPRGHLPENEWNREGHFGNNECN